MNAPVSIEILKQHLIDPEICIRCNTCEETCPIDAITHDGTNYVVRADVCNACMACVPPCPTGAIDNWRSVLRRQSRAAAKAGRVARAGNDGAAAIRRVAKRGICEQRPYR